MKISCGIRQRPAGHRYQHAAYTSFQVNYVVSGGVILEPGNEEVHVGEGQVYILGHGARIVLHHTDEPFQAVHATLYPESEEEEHVYEEYEGGVVVPAAPRRLRVLAELVLEEVRQPGIRSSNYLDGLGKAMIELALRTMQEEETASEHPRDAADWCERICRIIDSNIHSNASTAELLDGLGLSYRQLVRHFRAVKGITPKQYQMQRRLEQAKRMLLETQFPVTAIALDLGFSSTQNFSTQFSQLVGMSPTHYRLRRGKEKTLPQTADASAG